MLLRTTRGTPGSSARRLARRRAAAATAVVFGTVVVSALLALAGSPLAGAATLGMGWLWFRRLRVRQRQAVAGAAAERHVAARLRRAAAVVAYDVRMPGRSGDVDAVVLGPMLAAVEIKRASGRVRWFPDGRVKVGKRRLPGRPFLQAIGSAAAVRRALGVECHVEAVLCVTGMKQRPQAAVVNGVVVAVTSARHLRRVLRRLPRRVSPAEARHLAEQLR